MGKKFVYLIVAREDYPYFEKLVTPNSDCIVLYWKSEPEGGNPWDSIYFPNSTWSESRNRLLEVAYAKDDYEYFIFMDDDITLSEPFSKFEEFLLKYKPAIGYPKYDWHGSLNTKRRFFSNPIYWLRNYWFIKFRHNIQKPISWVSFDACFNAFHRDALPVCLPYVTKYDSTSWWWSQEMLYFPAFSQYLGNTKQANLIVASNHKSDSYPRDDMASDSLTQADKHMLDLIHPHRRQVFKPVMFPNSRSYSSPLSSSIEHSRTIEDLSTDFNLETEHWETTRKFWENLRGHWL